MIHSTEKTSRLDSPLKRWIPANYETLLVVIILILAVVSRFYDLGARAMSHDEINHVVPTFSLYTGRGYSYDPMSHGPFQFHSIALSYALFGDNDFTTRIPVALFGVGVIAIGLLLFRRYLGRTGALVAGLLLLISPFMLFYSRYARNEIFIVMWAILLMYSVLRYLERGERWSLFLFVVANAFHFTDKATSYMFAGGIFIFLFFHFVNRVSHLGWNSPRLRAFFLGGLSSALVLLLSGLTLYQVMKPVEVEAPYPLKGIILVGILSLMGLGAFILAAFAIIRGYGWENLRSERALDLMILLGTLILPLLTAIPIKWLVNPILGKLGKPTVELLAISNSSALWVALVATFLFAAAIGIGLWWFRKQWLFYAAVFFLPTVILYTTFFTYPQGLLSGFVSSFSYWFTQHFEGRGGQPYFYYFLIEIPMYEFLPALGTLLAALVAIFGRLWHSEPEKPFQSATIHEGQEQPVPTASLTVYWSVFSLVIFSYAGEKMPWITIHMALPMILATAWVTGWLIEVKPWTRLATWKLGHYLRAVILGIFTFLALITGRSAYKAAFINYDYPFEYLVYAHGTPDPKNLYQQIEEISYRTTGTTDLVVAYDNYVRYPYWWYLRRYPNKIDFDANPTRDARRAVIIAIGIQNEAKITPVVQKNYVEIDGMRLWWQNQDYWNLKWDNIAFERRNKLAQEYADLGQEIPEMNVFNYLEYAWPHIKPFFTDQATRKAVWQIWFNRDFTAWGDLRESNAYTLKDWGVSERMKTYIRRDLSNILWPFGAEATELTEPVDVYSDITLPATPDMVLGGIGSDPGLFLSPRQIAVAPDGSLYIADSLNHRVQHISSNGDILQVWGSYSNAALGTAPEGTFNEPWGIAVGPDGSIYVADTWNYRIQKFTSNGKFLTMWSSYPSNGMEIGFYGPRGIAVDSKGNVFVADTGNKVIVIFDSNGKYLAQVGMPGMGLGQFDEPVAIALDVFGNLYVTDTWNQRVQVLAPDASGLVFTPLAEWPVDGWYGQSLENKPFIAVESTGNVFISDPELCRLIEFSPVGDPVRVLDGCAVNAFQMPSGIASDGAGGLWIADSANGKLVHLKFDQPVIP